MTPRARVGLALAALPLALAVGCGGGAEQAATSAHPAGTIAQPPRSPFKGQPALGSGTAIDFTLRDQDGRNVRLSAQRGRLVLLTFLYTHCPDVCPLIAENLNTALRRLGTQRASARVLAVSVDPAHDTPRAVRRFVAEHRLLPQFRYLTGPPSALRQVWQAYNVLVEPRNLQRVDHSAYTLLIGRDGRPRVFFTPQQPAADVLHDLRVLLRA